jgi:glutathione S-transferase
MGAKLAARGKRRQSRSRDSTPGGHRQRARTRARITPTTGRREAAVVYVELVILLTVFEYMVLTTLVARARGKYGVKAPAISGHPVFDRTFRVQQNTLEGLVIFLPALWLFGRYLNPIWAAGLGVIWIAGRALYAAGYIRAAEKRGPGAGICGIVNVVLVAGALIGVLKVLV